MAENLFGAEDSEGFRDLARDQNPLLTTSVVLIRTTAYTGGDQDGGVTPSRTKVYIECPGNLRVMTGKDILSGGGLYALGDLEFTSAMVVLAADNRNVTEADKMLWNGIEHTLVGRPFPVPAAGGTTFYTSHWRRAS